MFKKFKFFYQNLTAYLSPNLPKDFDSYDYLRLNPDVQDQNTSAGWHYIHHGLKERRLYKFPKVLFNEGYSLDPQKETVLIVSHEASLTGAPILALNLAINFLNEFNVIVLNLGDGPLEERFLQSGAGVLRGKFLKDNPMIIDQFVRYLSNDISPKFAVLNTVESRFVLQSLAKCFVPTVFLIHEFSSNSRPIGIFDEIFVWATEVVFSTKLTLNDVLKDYPHLSNRRVNILPQGRCLLSFDSNNLNYQNEVAVIRSRVEELTSDDSVLILGAGFVQYRKGVDLFISIAAKVIAHPGLKKCKFIWVGKGYDPIYDVAYSAYLKYQIEVLGLENNIFFIDETIAIENIYKAADIFILPSRLDPLPNVIIDVMTYGKPIICFDGATGFSEFITSNNLNAECLANYLDVEDMANKVVNFVKDFNLRQRVGGELKNLARNKFDFEDYSNRIASLGIAAERHVVSEVQDVQTIRDSKLFSQKFALHPLAHHGSLDSSIHGYVRTWDAQVGCRKPYPGFHPGIYRELQIPSDTRVDPFAHFLRSGMPSGPWNYKVLPNKTKSEFKKKDLKVCLHLHIYYFDMLAGIIHRLNENKLCPDLFISVTSESVRRDVLKLFESYPRYQIFIKVVPNLGRDIGPLLTGFKEEIQNKYDFVGHIHTKKTKDIKDESVGRVWSEFILSNLIGGECSFVADKILEQMQLDNSICIVFPDDPNTIGWGKNKDIAENLKNYFNFNNLPDQFNFPVGTMFWARSDFLDYFFNLNLQWSDYPNEPLPYDGTLLHVLERFFGIIPWKKGKNYATTYMSGITR